MKGIKWDVKLHARKNPIDIAYCVLIGFPSTEVKINQWDIKKMYSFLKELLVPVNDLKKLTKIKDEKLVGGSHRNLITPLPRIYLDIQKHF